MIMESVVDCGIVAHVHKVCKSIQRLLYARSPHVDLHNCNRPQDTKQSTLLTV